MKLFFSYNNLPNQIYTTLKDPEHKFISVIKNKEGLYEKNYFKNMNEALKPKDFYNFVLLELYSKEENKFDYFFVTATQTELQITKNIIVYYKPGFKIELSFINDYSFYITKLDSNSGLSSKIFSFQKVLNKVAKIDHDFENFKEYIPNFSDFVFELSFLYLTIRENFQFMQDDNAKYRSYFIQEKHKIDKLLPKQKDFMADIRLDKEIVSDVEITNQDTLTSLESLIGLEKVKLEIRELKALAELRVKRLEVNLPVTPNTLHLVFKGNPGTGKTTVARLLGSIYKGFGLLKTDKVVEVSRVDLVEQYVGHSAKKTEQKFKLALGGILFIDEAYSLNQSGNDFGSEVISTLIKLMEDYRDNCMVIIAGYPDEMDKLLSVNPGLKSRFSKTIEFENYNYESLIKIIFKMISEYGNELSKGASYKLEELILLYYQKGYFESNARDLRNLFEKIILNQSVRLKPIKNPSLEIMKTFTPEDIPEKLE